jgi:hypothetical protein
LSEFFDGLFDPIVGDVIGRRLSAQAQMIADTLLEETVPIMSANHRVRKIETLDDGLKLSPVVLSDLATEDGGDLVGLADGAVGVQESLAQLIQCGAPVKDQVVTIFDLGEKEPVLTVGSDLRADRRYWSLSTYDLTVRTATSEMRPYKISASPKRLTVRRIQRKR